MLQTPPSDVESDDITAESPPSDETKRVFCEYIHPMLPVLSSATSRDVFNSTENSLFIRVLRLAVEAASAPYTIATDLPYGSYYDRQQLVRGCYNKAVV
jgi:hypothetical protein